jgi:hypothetical protein
MANAGKMTPDNIVGAWTSAEASIAAAQRIAFPMKYLAFINVVGRLRWSKSNENKISYGWRAAMRLGTR